MYKLRLFVAVIFASVVAVSCEETPVNDNLGNLADGFTLSVTGSTVNDITVSVKVTNDDVANYAVALISKESFTNTYESDLNEAAKAASALLVAEYNVDFTIVDDKYIFSDDASVKLGDSWTLTAGGSYVVLAYGVDAMGVQTTKVAFKNVVTKGESNWSEYADRIMLNEIAPDGDWIELYSLDREDVELDGFYILNENGDKTSLDGMVIEKNSLFVVDSKVNANGDVITLYDGKDKVVDTIDVDEVKIDASFGRKNDGADEWVEFKEPSRGEANGMAKYDGEPFTVEKLYCSDFVAAVTITPNKDLMSYNYAYITVPTLMFDDEEYFGGNLNLLADNGAYYYNYWTVDFYYADYKYILNNVCTVNLVETWPTYEDIVDYVTAVYAVDAEGNRVSEPVRIDSVVEGEHTPSKASYMEWLGDWDITCTASDGEPLVMEVSIVPNIDDYSYYIIGMNVSLMRNDYGATATLIEGVDEESGVAYSNLAVDANEVLLYFDPEQDNLQGKMVNGAFCGVEGETDLYLVSGSYYGFFGQIDPENAEQAILVGNEGQLGDGSKFNVQYFAPAILRTGENSVGVIYNDDLYGGEASTGELYPTSPYSLEKVEREAATPAMAKAPRSTMVANNVRKGMPNIYESAMFKALNAPRATEMMKYFVVK